MALNAALKIPQVAPRFAPIDVKEGAVTQSTIHPNGHCLRRLLVFVFLVCVSGLGV